MSRSSTRCRSIPAQHKTYTVRADGDDDATGTPDAPLRTIGQAVHRTPVGGICDVLLVGDVPMTLNVSIFAKRLRIQAAPGQASKPRIILGLNVDGLMICFQPACGEAIYIDNVDIVCPELAGATSALVRSRAANLAGPFGLSLKNVDITIPANSPAVRILEATWPGHIWSLSVFSVTGVAAGKWIEDVAADTDPDTLPAVSTNLASL